MGLAKELTDSQKGAIIAAKKLGHSDAAITKVIGCHRTTVLRFFAAHESKNSPQKRSGRPRILNQRDRQKLKTAVTANKKSRRQNLGEIAKKISKAKNRQISIRTVQRVLHEENLRSCIPLKKPLISEKNRKI